MRFREILEGYHDMYQTSKSDAAAAAHQPLQNIAPAQKMIDFAKRKQCIYRGLPSNEPYLMVDPSNWNRRAANTSNYVNLILSNAASWSAFPKRKLICSTNSGAADGYGEIYVVVPLDVNARVGICPASDMWISFAGKYDVEDVNACVDCAFEAYDIKPNQEDWQKFIQDCKDLNRCAYHDNEPQSNDYGSSVPHDLNGLFTDTIATLEKYLDPAANGFKVTNWGDFRTGPDHEVWLDSPCLLIKETVWDDMQ